MKQVIGCLSALLLGQALLFAEAEVGKPAPAFEVKDVQGKSVRLSDFKGKVVVLENYNLDCPFVANQYQQGAMQELQAELVGKGAAWLVVSSTYKDSGRARKESAGQKIKATAVVHDPKGAIGKEYGFKTTPHMVVIDKHGVVAYNGAIDDKPDADHDPRKARNYVREAVEKLSAGQPVAVARTKPYGCGAKYVE